MMMVRSVIGESGEGLQLCVRRAWLTGLQDCHAYEIIYPMTC